MPLDNLFNYDTKSSHLNHFAVTSHLPTSGIRQNSMSASKSIDRGIRRIWDNHEGPPSSKRIVHGCLQAIEAMELVHKVKCSIVSELYNRNGNRHDQKGILQHGGARVKCQK